MGRHRAIGRILGFLLAVPQKEVPVIFSDAAVSTTEGRSVKRSPIVVCLPISPPPWRLFSYKIETTRFPNPDINYNQVCYVDSKTP